MRDISIDLETLDNVPGAKILSAGLVRFDRFTGELGPKLYVKLSPTFTPGSVSRETIKWWLRQPKNVMDEAFSGKTSPSSACRQIAAFVQEVPDSLVWGNGSVFDVSILEWLMNEIGQGVPWSYYSARDLRTLVDVSGFDKKTMPLVGDAHNALDDAVHQAKIAFACFKRLRGE